VQLPSVVWAKPSPARAVWRPWMFSGQGLVFGLAFNQGDYHHQGQTIGDSGPSRLLSETPDAHDLAEMPGFVADRLMALNVGQHSGAGAHGRSSDRVKHRNGQPARAWETRVGAVDVKFPKLRKRAYFPEFLDPRRPGSHARPRQCGAMFARWPSVKTVRIRVAFNVGDLESVSR